LAYITTIYLCHVFSSALSNEDQVRADVGRLSTNLSLLAEVALNDNLVDIKTPEEMPHGMVLKCLVHKS